jgi:oligogalacturonide lyase
MLKNLPSEKTIFTDEKTGREVWQMTSGNAVNHGCYQEVEAFSADNRYVIYASNRTGSFQLYRMDLESGEQAQLSDVKSFNNISMAFDRDGKNIYCSAGWHLFDVDLATGETRTVIDFREKLPNPPWGLPLTLSSCGSLTAVVYQSAESEWRLAIVGLETGEFNDVYSRNEMFLHAQICPGDSNLITVVPHLDRQSEHSEPSEIRARNWIIDAKSGTARPFLCAPVGQRATHEYWDHTGDRLYFHTKTDVPGRLPATISSIDRTGGDLRIVHKNETRKLGHSQIDRRSEFIISDVQRDPPNELSRIDVKTGEREILCWPNTTNIADQTVHTHPCISPNGAYCSFTSDRLGSSDLYIFPLNR